MLGVSHSCWLLIELLNVAVIVTALGSPSGDFQDPRELNGSWLTYAGATHPPGLGEPLNIVISARSDADALTETVFEDWLRSVGFAQECLGFHLGGPQAANLGDGNELKNQTGIYRWSYGILSVGTCLETLEGGNHVRYWFQNGPLANTGAIFMAVSAEEDLGQSHTIIPNGYDLGRDWLLGNATKNGNTTSPQTGVRYNVTYTMLQGYLRLGRKGINHGIALDGYIAVVNLTIVDTSATILTPWAIPILALFVISTALGGYFSFLVLHPSHDYTQLSNEEQNDKNLHRNEAKKALLHQLKS